MVRLGARAPANNNRAPGSVYGFYGGNLDGAGRATGIAIESGRETRVQNVAIKRCHVGIHVTKGANGGSADCDVRDIDMTGNNEPGSVGLLVEAPSPAARSRERAGDADDLVEEGRRGGVERRVGDEA